MKNNTRPIGEIFEHNGVTLKIVASKYCKNCYFNNEKKQYCEIGIKSENLSSVGLCSPLFRNDHTGVSFIKQQNNKTRIQQPATSNEKPAT